MDVIFELPGTDRNTRSIFLRHIVQRFPRGLRAPGNKLIAVWLGTDVNTTLKRLDITGNDSLGILYLIEKHLELPTLSEGFDEIWIVKSSNYVPSEDEYYLIQAEYHCQYHGKDPVEAKKKLEEWTRRTSDD